MQFCVSFRFECRFGFLGCLDVPIPQCPVLQGQIPEPGSELGRRSKGPGQEADAHRVGKLLIKWEQECGFECSNGRDQGGNQVAKIHHSDANHGQQQSLGLYLSGPQPFVPSHNESNLNHQKQHEVVNEATH